MAFTRTLFRMRHSKLSVELVQRNLTTLNIGVANQKLMNTEWRKLGQTSPRNLCTLSHLRKTHSLNQPASCLCLQNSVILSSIRAYSPDSGEGSEKRSHPRTEVDYDELQDLIQEGNILLIDVREPKEIEQTGLMPGAINIPITKLKNSLNMEEQTFTETYKAPKPSGQGENLIFYGLSNVKSDSASELAHKAGLKKARHFPGGWKEWSEKLPSN